jgi:hypothetical protein
MAKVIGADENELLSAYSDIIKQSPHEDKYLSIPAKEKPKLNINFILLLSLIILFLGGALVGLTFIFQKDDKVSIEPNPPVLKSKQVTTGETNSDNLSAIIPKIEEPPSSLKETDVAPKTSSTTPIMPAQNLKENISGEPTLSNQVLKKETTLEEKNTTSEISNKE